MTEIPEIKGGDAEIMSAVGQAKRRAMAEDARYAADWRNDPDGAFHRLMAEQAEIIKAQRDALREARRILWLLDRAEEIHHYHVNYHDVGPIAEKARAWLAAHPEEKGNE